MSDELAAERAAAAGLLGGDEDTSRQLLQSIVDVARTIFAAEDTPKARRGAVSSRDPVRAGTALSVRVTITGDADAANGPNMTGPCKA